MKSHVIIIGGGISGLAAAHRLSEQQVQVTLLEASPRLGGTIHTEQRDGFLLERGPDSFISEKPQAVELAKRLGLESRWTAATGARGVSVTRAVAALAVYHQRYL
jgi:oxygen-dependent protoporphyrinogen oxidase